MKPFSSDRPKSSRPVKKTRDEEPRAHAPATTFTAAGRKPPQARENEGAPPRDDRPERQASRERGPRPEKKWYEGMATDDRTRAKKRAQARTSDRRQAGPKKSYRANEQERRPMGTAAVPAHSRPERVGTNPEGKWKRPIYGQSDARPDDRRPMRTEKPYGEKARESASRYGAAGNDRPYRAAPARDTADALVGRQPVRHRSVRTRRRGSSESLA